MQPCSFTIDFLLTAVIDFLLISSPVTSVISLLNSMGQCMFLQKYCHPASSSPKNFFQGSLAAAAPLLIIPAGFWDKGNLFFSTSIKCVSKRICLLGISEV